MIIKRLTWTNRAAYRPVVGSSLEKQSLVQGHVPWPASCMHWPQCLAGDHNLCPTAEGTMIGRHGGWATRVRCDQYGAIPIPAELDAAKAGPLFCGGITVFNPLVQFAVRPTDRVAVIGIGGLGHLAFRFRRARSSTSKIPRCSSRSPKESSALCTRTSRPPARSWLHSAFETGKRNSSKP
jgi:D-arabinose 1-dehydrogenase-like Zn-dependent alcohol dehydrogenase